MKKAINPQSQNEVKDLLNEYVVSPLNNDISQTLVQMKDEIEQLGDSTNAELKNSLQLFKKTFEDCKNCWISVSILKMKKMLLKILVMILKMQRVKLQRKFPPVKPFNLRKSGKYMIFWSS